MNISEFPKFKNISDYPRLTQEWIRKLKSEPELAAYFTGMAQKNELGAIGEYHPAFGALRHFLPDDYDREISQISSNEAIEFIRLG